MVTIRRLSWSNQDSQYVAITDAYGDDHQVVVDTSGWVHVYHVALRAVSYPPNVVLEIVWGAS